MSFSYLRGGIKISYSNDTEYLTEKMVSCRANCVSRRANLFLTSKGTGYGR